MMKTLGRTAFVVVTLLTLNTAHSQCEISPTIVLSPSDGPIEGFGLALAMDDQWLIVGTPFYQSRKGAVYVFQKIGSDWIETQKLLASDGTTDDRFGMAVALDGNTLAVGADFSHHVRNLGGPGAAYVFLFDGSNWIEHQRIESPTPRIGERFGSSVAVRGDRIVVGSEPESGFANAYLFEGEAAHWTPVEVLAAVSDSNNGARVATNLASVFVSNSLGSSSFAGEGSISAFVREGKSWVIHQRIARPFLPFYGGLGFTASLAANDDRLLIGAPGAANVIPPIDNPGAVYLFERTGDEWNPETRLQARDGAHSDHFGESVAVAGDFVVAGAVNDPPKGSAYLFKRTNGAWNQIREVKPDLGSTWFQRFGSAIAANSDSFAVGSRESSRIHVYPMEGDCDNNGLNDQCEIANFGLNDCNGNEVPDSCESMTDCNLNSIQDLCDLAFSASRDCNDNEVPDECEPPSDCNSNNEQDICEQNWDCQPNGIPDACEVESALVPDKNSDNIPDACQCTGCTPPDAFDGPCFFQKAVAINGQPIASTNHAYVRPGDTITTEVYVACWSKFVPEASGFQIQMANTGAAHSGHSGTILPLGWDAPIELDPCPCEDPQYPVCQPGFGCTGKSHNPEAAVFIDTTRSDFLLSGLDVIWAADVSTLNVRLGADHFGEAGAVDDGLARYCGTEILVASPDAQGEFRFELQTGPFRTELYDQYGLLLLIGHSEGLLIDVDCDDGIFCNGVEVFKGNRCNAGYLPCDDGLNCTVDSCNEAASSCYHLEDSSRCDDGDPSTHDECTPNGCTHATDIPTMSTWSLVILTCLFFICAKIAFERRPDSNNR